jgi:GMP synthase-like glutamine amidotransferase
MKSPESFDPQRIERAAHQTERRLTEYLTTLTTVQQQFAEAMANRKPLLLVDTTFSRAAGAYQASLEHLRSTEWKAVAEVYIETVFKNLPPATTAEIFQRFLGTDVPIQYHNIGDSMPELNDISGVILAGSPANVTYALNQFKHDPVYGNTPLTHSKVFEATRSIYQQAKDLNLPVTGICYGQHVVTHENQGEIYRTSQHGELGIVKTKPTEYSTTVLMGGLGFSEPLQGEVASIHDEGTTRGQHNADHSAILLEASEDKPGLIHGLLHIPNGTFTGNANEDAQLVKRTLAEGEHAALTFQVHPEYTAAMPLIEFFVRLKQTGQPDYSVFERNYSTQLATTMLSLMRQFYERFGHALG